MGGCWSVEPLLSGRTLTSIGWRTAAGSTSRCRRGFQDIHGDNGAFCYKGLRHSLCHGWASGPTAFLAEDVLGIHILEAGCGAIELRPKLGDLQWARGTYPTPLGILRVEHCRQPDGDIRDYVGCTRRHASSIAIGSVKSLLQAPWVWLCSNKA